MPSLRAFFIGLPLGLLLAAGGYFGLFLFSLGSGGGAGVQTTLELFQRKEELAAASDRPRLLVVGGSGVLFGVKAAMIERETGLRSVNLGVMAGLGTRYLLTRTARILRPGDTVLLIPEYELYNLGRENLDEWVDPFFIAFVTSGDPAYFQTFPLLDRLKIALKHDLRELRRNVEARITGRRAKSEEGFYNVANLDDHGDLINHHRSAKPAALQVEYHGDKLDLGVMDTQFGGWREMDEFLAVAREKGVRVIAAYPNVAWDSFYAAPDFQPKRELMRAFWAERGVPVLGGPFDAMMPRDDLFDTVYHPVREAAEARTARLIELLRPVLQDGARPQ